MRNPLLYVGSTRGLQGPAECFARAAGPVGRLGRWLLVAGLGLLGAQAAQAQTLNYAAAGATNATGTYTDLGTAGTIITTANLDDATSAAQNIGFTFTYNGQAFTQFVLNTNGFIKLGAVAPSIDALYTPLSSADPLDANTIAPLANDLEGSATVPTEYRVSTSGAAGTQVCTIQWKGVRDYAFTTPQFASEQFQVKLYEGTNQVEFVYGTWTAGAAAPLGRNHEVGIRGTTNAAADRAQAAKPSSSTAWSVVTFAAGTAGAVGPTFFARNTFLPDAGRTFRFMTSVLLANDVAVTSVFSLGQAAQSYSTPHAAQAIVTNNSAGTLTNIPVTLTVTGANAFTNVQTVASLASGASALVTFAGYPLTTQGVNTLTVTVPSDDLNTNNSKAYSQNVTASRLAYIDATQSLNTGSIGVGQAGGVLVVRHTLAQAGTIASVTPTFTGAGAGATTYQVLLYDATGAGGTPGTVLYTSPTQTRPTATGSPVVTIPNVAIAAGDFFVGLKELDNNLNLGYQTEDPLRQNTYYFQAGGAFISVNSTGLRPRLALEASVVPAPACVPLANLAAANVTTTSASLTFTPATGASYTVTYTPAGGTATTISPNPTASPVALSGLTPGTTYNVSVVTNCVGGTTSPPATVTFTTLFPVPANDQCAGAVALACGQTVTGTTNGATTTGDPTGSCGATGVTAQPGVFYSFTGTGAIVTVSTCSGPTATAGDTKLFVYSGPCGTYTCVGGSDDIGTGVCSANGAASAVTFASVAGTQYLIFVQGFSAALDFGLSLTCVAPPTCAPVTNLAATGITTTSANLTFTAGNGNTSYTVTYTPAGGAAQTVTPSPTASPVALSGLTPGTAYAVSVQPLCSAGGTATPSTLNFTTLTPPPANDECAGAISLTAGAPGAACNAVAGSTAGATASTAAGTCVGTADDDVWYSFVATSAAHTITVVGATGFDAVVNLRAGACPGTTVGTCQDATAGGGTETIAATGLAVGSTYLVRVFHYFTGSGSGAFTICVTTPAPPPCNAPTAPGTAAITSTSANVTFTASASAVTYTVTATPATGPVVTASGAGSPIALTGLAPNTAYSVNIVSNCAGGQTSSAATTSFSTLPTPPTDLTVSTPQNVSGTYNNVTVTGPNGVATLTGSLTVNGTLTVQSGGILVQNCQALTGPGNFLLLAGAELQICDPLGITSTGPTGAVQLAGSRSYAADASYTYNGTVPQVTGPALPATVRNVTVNNAAGLNMVQALSVTRVARLTAGDLATHGFIFTLLSSAAGTALVDNTGGVVIGTSTMQRAVTNAVTGPAYRHFSSPVQSTTLADLVTTGFSPTFNTQYNISPTPSTVSPFPTVFGYDQARIATVTSTYGAFDKGFFSPNGAGDVMQPTHGYTVNAPATATPIDFVGTFNNAAQNSGPLSRGTDPQAGWQLLGNPYPSPLDWGTVTAGQRPGMDAAMYVYQSTGQYAGTYRTSVNNMGPSDLIDAGSGYFARVTAPGGSGAVNLANANRVTNFGAEPAFGRGADSRPQVRLLVTGAGQTDEALVYLERGATAGIDAEYDATKLANPTGLNLASLHGNAQLAINGLPPLGGTEVVIPLTLGVPQAGAFGFEVANLANFGTATVYLRDALTGTQQVLAAGTRYPFSVATASAGTARFSLVLRPANATATAAGLTAAAVSLYPNPAHQRFTVLLPPLAGQREVRATLVNALGQVVHTRTIALTAAGATAEFGTQTLATGVYLLRLQVENQLLTKRVVVE